MPPDSEMASSPSALKPLVVDLDGTLICSDLLIQSAFAYLGDNPSRLMRLLSLVPHGRAALKAEIARETSIDVSLLPYDENVVSLIRQRRAAGDRVYLVSASDKTYVQGVADHLGLFDGWFASNAGANLSAASKARRLLETFGEDGFDYVGNSRADLAVWAVARQCIAVRASPAVRSKLLSISPDATVLENTMGRGSEWVRLLRMHQWSKNALVFVPLVTAQRFDLLALGEASGAFLVLSLAASAVYVLNDLVDLEADRKHPNKKRRPLATGAIPITGAMALIPFLLTVAFLGAWAIGLSFFAVLLAYLALTTAYTFVLKRKMLVDVLTLASLYTIRVIAGAAAITVPISEWLLGFSMFVFTSLALIKRYVELATRIDEGLPDPTNRNYLRSDLGIVSTLAATASFNAVTVFALYISSDAVRPLYRYPQLLWLICPILMYWLGRILLMAHRRLMPDDPILFALRDWNSYVALGLVGLILIGAR